MLLNKCQSTRAGKSKQLLNALQRFNTKCLLLAVAGGEGEGAEEGGLGEAQVLRLEACTLGCHWVGGGVWGVWGLGAWYLHCFDALHGVECAISQRLNVVVVQREQAEAVQVAEGILAYAGDLVGIQQQQLQRAESFEHARG